MSAHRATLFARLALVLVLLSGAAALVAFTAPRADAASGRLIWKHTLASTGDRDDFFFRATKAPNGGLYTAGTWATDWDALGDLATYRFREAGTGARALQWSRRWDNPAEHKADLGEEITTDANGNVIVAGMTNKAGLGRRSLVVKRSSSGALKWAATCDAVQEETGGVACDRAGNVYVCGFAIVESGGSDFVVAKFRASDGAVLWTYRYAGDQVENDSNQADAIVADAAGNTYVVGRSDNEQRVPDGIVMKLDTGGHRVWMDRLRDMNPAQTDLTQVALRGSALYVAGRIPDVTAQKADVLLARYSLSGVQKWLVDWTADADAYSSTVYAFAIDGLGNPVVGGSSYFDEGNKAFVASWTPAGQKRWSRSYWIEGEGLHESGVHALAADGRGNVWAAGYLAKRSSVDDSMVMRLSPSGRIKWVRTVIAPNGSTGSFQAVVYSGARSLYAVGLVGSYKSYDTMIVRLEP